MNKIMLTLAAVMTMSFAACAQNKGEKNMQTIRLHSGVEMPQEGFGVLQVS